MGEADGTGDHHLAIREIDGTDLEEVQGFLWTHEFAFRDSLPERYTPKTPEAMRLRAERLMAALVEGRPRYYCLAAFLGPRIVASIYIEVWNIDDRDAAHVHGLWVDPGFRRRGLARDLKLRAESWAVAAGCALMDANVLVSNAGMIALNQALGYEIKRYNFRKELG